MRTIFRIFFHTKLDWNPSESRWTQVKIPFDSFNYLSEKWISFFRLLSMCGTSSHLCLSNRIVVQCGELIRNIAIAEKLKIVAFGKNLLSLVIRIISSCDRICTEIVPMFIMKDD